jgi:hypothetical protein
MEPNEEVAWTYDKASSRADPFAKSDIYIFCIHDFLPEKSTTREQAFGRCPKFTIVSAKSAPGTKRYLVPVGNSDRD